MQLQFRQSQRSRVLDRDRARSDHYFHAFVEVFQGADQVRDQRRSPRRTSSSPSSSNRQRPCLSSWAKAARSVARSPPATCPTAASSNASSISPGRLASRCRWTTIGVGWPGRRTQCAAAVRSAVLLPPPGSPTRRTRPRRRSASSQAAPRGLSSSGTFTRMLASATSNGRSHSSASAPKRRSVVPPARPSPGGRTAPSRRQWARSAPLTKTAGIRDGTRLAPARARRDLHGPGPALAPRR